MIAFYNGVTGMMAYQEQLNVVGHNIANVNTNGYKASRSSFSDLLYTQVNTKVEGENLVGHGVKHQDTDLIMNESGLNMTDNALDFAITGQGFFGVDNNGSVEYTRDGAFYLSPVGKSVYLVTADGAGVLDNKGARLKLELDDNGNVITEGLDTKLGLYTFENPFGLEPVNNVRFLETDTSGKAELQKTANGRRSSNKTSTAEPPKIIQGSLEFSGVDLGGEMVQMILAQRAFQMNARVVQTADELDTTINNLR